MGQLEKYEIGRILGEGTFGKVKLAKHIDSGLLFAIKILEKTRIRHLQASEQIVREITALKMLKHPNVVRLHEVLASKTKIYMVLELVNGSELFNIIMCRGKLTETEGRNMFQQIMDAVSYCHGKGIAHRDLKLENLLVDGNGNVKITDFGLSALPENLQGDALLHTTCGSPNYVAPEVLRNKGYNGVVSDVWSCGVILFTMLTGYLPFDDRNFVVLYQKIFKGDVGIPNWLSAECRNLIRRMLDPNPATRITMSEVKDDDWFKKSYTPIEGEDDKYSWERALCGQFEDETCRLTKEINAFELIGMSSSLDLSGFFENENAYERTVRFVSQHSRAYLLKKMEDSCTQMGCQVQTKNGTLKIVQQCKMTSLCVFAEVLDISDFLHVVELRKIAGGCSAYKMLHAKLLKDLGSIV